MSTRVFPLLRRKQLVFLIFTSADSHQFTLKKLFARQRGKYLSAVQPDSHIAQSFQAAGGLIALRVKGYRSF